jgi:5-amino-6-(5-phosphoribosylamino)uracil reductase
MAIYVIQKCAMSVDGFIDDASNERLILSNKEDFERVNALRAECDAILVGAGTVRADNPKLQTKDSAKQPMKVTLTRSQDFDPNNNFIVYRPKAGEADVDLKHMLSDLEQKGVKKLLIEAGTTIGTAFLKAGLVNELQVSIAPFFVGDLAAPRMVGEGPFYHDKAHRMKLARVEQLGDMALLTYHLG